MSELEIKASDFFTFTLGYKNEELCRVAFCRRKRVSKGNKLCNRCKSRLKRARNPLKNAYYDLRSNAKRRGVDISLTLEEYMLLAESTGYGEGKGREGRALHLDRIDPGQGYHLHNLQVVTCSENVAKGNVERRKRYALTKDGRQVEINSVQYAHPTDSPEPDPF